VIGDLTDGLVRTTQKSITAKALAESSATLVPPGAVLIAMYGSIGKLGIAEIEMATNQAIAFALPREDIAPRYLFHYLASQRDQLAGAGKGATQRNISQTILRAWPIPVPPLDEQRRIVDILEDHLSRLDTADRLIEHAVARLARLVASALRSSPELDGASTLPLRDLLRQPLANGRSVPTRAGGFPVLRLTALKGDRVQLSERKSGAWKEVDAEPFLVIRDDIFVSRGNGSLSLVGRASRVVDEPDPVAFPDTMVRLRVDGSLIDAEYLVEVWNSRLVRNQIERAARTTAGIYKVNQGQLGDVELPVPQREAQSKVVARLSSVREAAKTVADQMRITQARSRSLRSALLAAAFSGRLTGRSSDLNHAEELVS
jgi:type I restriction enzyme S subunit